MARRRKDDGASVNLFPFLSILVCIIGCLTLIIVVVNLIAMGKGEGRTPEEVERAREYLVVKKEKEEKQEQQDKVKQLIENLIQKNKDTLDARDKLARLKEMLNSQEDIDASREELIAKFNILTQTNKKLANDHEKLQASIKVKEEEIAKRKLPPEPAALKVRPTGSSTNVRPHFVEISEAGIYIHKSLSEEPAAIPIASINQSEEFIQLLDLVSESTSHSLIFLVRGNDGAAGAFAKVNDVVATYNQGREKKAIPGKLPLPGEGKVDLSVFAKFMEP
jgi:Na+-transporting methylmalonyl-CoA/oxaloacetate decarboxylase gamma subunit